jgi:cytochrome c-type biogenesis protein CcmH/NrfG
MVDPATRAESIQLMTRAIQEKPNDYVPRTNLAQAHWMDGRLNEALAAMDSALRLRPGDPVLVKLKADMQASGAATQSTSGGL